MQKAHLDGSSGDGLGLHKKKRSEQGAIVLQFMKNELAGFGQCRVSPLQGTFAGLPVVFGSKSPSRDPKDQDSGGLAAPYRETGANFICHQWN